MSKSEEMDVEAKTEATKVRSYLEQPYTRLVVPESDGTYRGEVLEFPGCFATGDTPAEAYAELEEAAADWLAAAMERGQNIPDPFENVDFSGRLVLRLPKSLHKKAARLAERDHVSLNQFIVAAVSEYVGERVSFLTSSAITMNMNTTIGNMIVCSYGSAGTAHQYESQFNTYAVNGSGALNSNSMAGVGFVSGNTLSGTDLVRDSGYLLMIPALPRPR